MVRDQECSGLSVTAFCRGRGVAPSTFYAWRRKLAGAATFAEVKVSPDSAREAVGVELRLAGGDCVVIRPGFDRQTLIDLLHVLDERASGHSVRVVSA